MTGDKRQPPGDGSDPVDHEAGADLAGKCNAGKAAVDYWVSSEPRTCATCGVVSVPPS